MKATTSDETHLIVDSSLTAVGLRQLTRPELGLSMLLIAAITGFVLGLNLAERRRSFASPAALGARPAQVGEFLWSEGFVVVVIGSVFGTASGFSIAKTLVAILAGSFDPPPEILAVPWGYRALKDATALASAAIAIALIRRQAARPDLEALRFR